MRDRRKGARYAAPMRFETKSLFGPSRTTHGDDALRNLRGFAGFRSTCACVLTVTIGLSVESAAFAMGVTGFTGASAALGVSEATASQESKASQDGKGSQTSPKAPASKPAAPQTEAPKAPAQPAQQEKPTASERPDAVAPSLPSPAGAPGKNLPGMREGDAIEPAAQAILDRHDKVAMGMQSLQLTTEQLTRSFGTEGSVAKRTQEPCKIALEFPVRDGMTMPHMAITVMISDKPSSGLAYDGRGGILLDHETKRAAASNGFPVQGHAYLVSLPQWTMDRRSRGLMASKQTGTQINANIVAGKVVGVEKIDGEECDLVTFAVSVPKMAEMPDPATDKPQATYFRVFETVAFARKDGLPRRLVAVSEVPGEGPLGDQELTILYRNVQVNEPIPAGTFQVRVPEGYEVGALQGQQAAPAPAP